MTRRTPSRPARRWATLSAVAACAHAAITFWGRGDADWEPLLGLFGLARYLAPAPGSCPPPAPARAHACPETGHDVHREHPAPPTLPATVTVTMSIPAPP